MPFKLIVLCLFVSLASGCTKNHPSAYTNKAKPLMLAQFEQGKTHYAAARYYQAFQLLEPLARYNHPEAQYAVAYMYYNGEGVGQNLDLAKLWMQRAANLGHEPAISALPLMGMKTQAASSFVK